MGVRFAISFHLSLLGNKTSQRLNEQRESESGIFALICGCCLAKFKLFLTEISFEKDFSKEIGIYDNLHHININLFKSHNFYCGYT
jgi:hypothetical protein